MTDLVNHPSHYAVGWSNGAEVIDITENLNFNRGNAVKYIARAGRKDPALEIEDLRKAQWYIEREIYRLGEGPRDPILDAKMAEEDCSFFIEHMTQPAKTRVWEKIRDVPEGVKVADRDGAHFWWRGGRLRWGSGDGMPWVPVIGESFDEDLRPFTEVLETHE